jgi:hypothetical protein
VEKLKHRVKVTIPFDGDHENWTEYKNKLKMMLLEEGLLFVMMNEPEEVESEMMKQFLVIVATHVKHLETGDPYGAWQALCEHYDSKTSTNVYALRMKMQDMKCSQHESLMKYVAELRDIYNRLERSGAKMDEDQLKISFFRG